MGQRLSRNKFLVIRNIRTAFIHLFSTRITTPYQIALVFLVASLFIFLPMGDPVDWKLNTAEFWRDFPNTYQNPYTVYPPWALILLLPYKWMHPEGVRFFSVLVGGWLVHQQKWPLFTFFAILLSPYYLLTIGAANADILVYVLPVLLWRSVENSRWKHLLRGIALSLLLVKPQGAVLIILYLLWNSRKQWAGLIWSGAVVGLITIPISLIGSPPLILQWLDNIAHPPPEFADYWSVNNLSLTTKFTIPGALALLLLIALLFTRLVRHKTMVWTNNHTTASLFYLSMALSPYCSQQGLASALAFVPSWGAVLIQAAVLIFAISTKIWYYQITAWFLLFAVTSLLLYRQPAGKTLVPPESA